MSMSIKLIQFQLKLKICITTITFFKIITVFPIFIFLICLTTLFWLFNGPLLLLLFFWSDDLVEGPLGAIALVYSGGSGGFANEGEGCRWWCIDGMIFSGCCGSTSEGAFLMILLEVPLESQLSSFISQTVRIYALRIHHSKLLRHNKFLLHLLQLSLMMVLWTVKKALLAGAIQQVVVLRLALLGASPVKIWVKIVVVVVLILFVHLKPVMFVKL